MRGRFYLLSGTRARTAAASVKIDAQLRPMVHSSYKAVGFLLHGQCPADRRGSESPTVAQLGAPAYVRARENTLTEVGRTVPQSKDFASDAGER